MTYINNTFEILYGVKGVNPRITILYNTSTDFHKLCPLSTVFFFLFLFIFISVDQIKAQVQNKNKNPTRNNLIQTLVSVSNTFLMVFEF